MRKKKRKELHDSLVRILDSSLKHSGEEIFTSIETILKNRKSRMRTFLKNTASTFVFVLAIILADGKFPTVRRNATDLIKRKVCLEMFSRTLELEIDCPSKDSSLEN